MNPMSEVRGQEDYADALAARLPEGPFWAGFRDADGRGRALLTAKAKGPADIDARARDLVREANPLGALETLDARETEAGLPDACSAGVATTVQERRAAVAAKWASRGGQSIAYFVGLAAKLGYGVEVDEWRPFVAGWSACGDVLGGAPANRHYWRVRVLGPRVTLFRCGASRCVDRLGKIARAEDLECRLHALKPAHTHLTVGYEGA